MAIFQSASKIAFLLLTLALCAALFCGKVEAKDFMYICGMAFTYYFSTNKRGTGPQGQ